MSFKQKNWQVAIIILMIVLPMISFAAITSGGPCDPEAGPGKISNPLGCTRTIPQFIKYVLEGFLKIGIPVVALAIIYSGFLFVFAVGNTEKVKKAKTTLMYTLIGAAILLGSWAIAELISNTVTGLKS